MGRGPRAGLFRPFKQWNWTGILAAYLTKKDILAQPFYGPAHNGLAHLAYKPFLFTHGKLETQSLCFQLQIIHPRSSVFRR